MKKGKLTTFSCSSKPICLSNLPTSIQTVKEYTEYVHHLDFKRDPGVSRGNTHSYWHFSQEVSTSIDYIDEVFKLTADGRATLFQVIYRVANSYEGIQLNGSVDLFDIEKFLYFQYICCQQHQTKGEITYSSLAATPASSDVLFQFFINSTLEKRNMLKIALVFKHATILSEFLDKTFCCLL